MIQIKLDPFLSPLYRDLAQIELLSYLHTTDFSRYCILERYTSGWDEIRQNQDSVDNHLRVYYEDVWGGYTILYSFLDFLYMWGCLDDRKNLRTLKNFAKSLKKI